MGTKNVLLRMGPVVIPKRHILNDVTIGAGSTTIKNPGPGGVYVGNPARRFLRSIIETDDPERLQDENVKYKREQAPVGNLLSFIREFLIYT